MTPLGGPNSLLFAIDSMKGTGNGTKSATTQYATIPVEYFEYSGDTTYSTNPTLGNATADASMLAVRYTGNLTIDSGVTLTPQARKRGMFIFVDGTLTVNGTISMTARGAANVAGAHIFILNSGGSAYEIPAVGGAGGAGVSANGSYYNGNKGGDGLNGGTGGGGSGGAVYTGATARGGNGTSYSGGAGSGGGGNSGQGSDIGGAGGNAASAGCQGSNRCHKGGGAGNPGGTYTCDPTYTYACGTNGSDGTGGLLIVYARSIVIGTAGIIQSNGSTGGFCGGAGSGGGSVNIFYTDTFTNNGLLSANGGGNNNCSGADGGKGGNGTVRSVQYVP
jgi:hypothetical protein